MVGSVLFQVHLAEQIAVSLRDSVLQNITSQAFAASPHLPMNAQQNQLQVRGEVDLPEKPDPQRFWNELLGDNSSTPANL